MKKHFYIFLCFIFTTAYVSADNKETKVVEIFGTILDSITSKPIQSASIKIFLDNIKAKPLFLVSDSKGAFKTRLISDKEYLVEISYIGMRPLKFKIKVKRDNLNLGELYLREESLNLSEITIKAEKKIVSLNSNGFSYNLKNDPSIKSDNLLEAFRKVPLVYVDGNGKITVKGGADYVFYLNGKPYTLANAHPKEILQSIPAASIERIEVITNLEARHDASLGSVILNIVTTKKKTNGYRIALNTEAATFPSMSQGVTSLITKGKLSTSIGYNFNKIFYNDIPSYSNTEYSSGESKAIHSANWTATARHTNHVLRGFLEYIIDSLNSVYADANYLFVQKNMETVTNQKYANSTSNYLLSTDNHVFLSDGASEFNSSYQNLYKNKKERFLLAYRYSYNPDNRKYDVTGIYNNNETSSDSTYHRRGNSKGGLSEHTVQADYTIPIGHHSFSVGTKYINRLNDSQPQYYTWNTQKKGWDENNNNEKFIQKQQVFSNYFSYKLNLRKFTSSLGVRAENTYEKVKFENSTKSELTHKNFNLLPRFSASWNLSENSQLSASYAVSVRRPAIWQTNSYKEQLDEFSMIKGNPNLRDETINNFDLSYFYYTNNFVLSIWSDYSDKHNAIMRYPITEEDNDKTICYTYDNLGNYKKLSGSIYTDYHPIPQLGLNINGSLAHICMKSDILDLKSSATSYSLACNVDYEPGKNYYLGANWAIFQQDPEMQISYKHFQQYSFYIKKGFLKKRLNAGLTLNNIFSKYSYTDKTTNNINFLQKEHFNIIARNIILSINYAFGGGKSSAKRKSIVINNDLLNSTGVK